VEGGHCCLDGAGGRQQALWVADPQHPPDRLTGDCRPTYAGPRAADRDPVQRREALGSKEIQAAQIKDQPAATQQMPSVYSVRVSALDASMSPWALMTTTDDPSR
jgi:hypothetical protein